MSVSRGVRACALAVLFMLPVVRGTASAQNREPEGDDVKTRVKAFRSARADAQGYIAPDAWSKAWQSFNEFAPAPTLQFADASWRSIGPNGMFGNQINFGGIGQLLAGRVTSISFDPTNSQVFYIGAATGGVWKTTTGGMSWTPLTDNQCAPGIGTVVVDPVNPNIVYAGTGELNTFEFPGCGVLRSIDGGATWTATAPTPAVQFHGRIIIDPATAGSTTSTALVSATDNGIFVSSNSGATWTQKITGFGYGAVALAGRPGTLFASAISNARSPVSTVWESTNSGATWTALPTPLASFSQFARIELATSASSPDFVFALAADVNTRKFIGLYRWDVRTGFWTTLPVSGLVTSQDAYPLTMGEQGEYDLVLTVDPRTTNRIWIAGVGAFASTDGGASFRSFAQGVHVDWHALTIDPSDPDHMVAGTDGGAYVSYDGGRSWRSQNNGLSIAQFYPGISVHPSGLWIYGGLQDNAAVYFSGSSVWNNFSFLGDGGFTAINYANPSIVYVTHAFENFITRKSSTLVEEERETGIGTNDRGGVPRPIVMDPLTPTKLYFGTQRLYRTLNEGQMWTPLTGDITRGSGYITTIAIAPTNPNVIYAGTSDGNIAVSQNGGNSFTTFAFATARHFTRLAVDPLDANHVVATASTFGAPKITQSVDGGASFNSAISTNLANIPVHTALFIPGTSTLMIGVEYGVLQTSNNGTSWTQGPPGLPNTVVYDLAYIPTTTTVIASTYGRGMFAFKVGASTTVLRGDVDGDTRVTAQDAFLIQQALVGIDLTPLQAYPRGDANCDTKLDGRDVVVVLRQSVGLPNPGVCVGTAAIRVDGTPDPVTRMR